MKLTSAVGNLFKRYFVAGTIVLVPIIGTILILRFIISWTDDLMMSLVPLRIRPQELFGWSIPGIGLLATIVIILFAGFITRLYVGKKLVSLGDHLISKIPLGRGIYGGIKQLMSTILARNHSKFQSVVAVEFPRHGMWMIGFVTGDALPEARANDERHWINIFIPTSPNPTSGFLVMVPRAETRALSMSVEEAFKLIISGGIIRDENSRDAGCGTRDAGSLV